MLTIKNGAIGISDFKLKFLFLNPNNFLGKTISNKLVKAPTQKPTIKLNRPAESPKHQPIPNINFPSPKPISRPLENSQRSTKGNAKTGPAIRDCQEGRIKTGPPGKGFIKRRRKEITING